MRISLDKLFILCYTVGIGSVTGWDAYFNAYTIAFTWDSVKLL
jgi:hypothetical protein